MPKIRDINFFEPKKNYIINGDFDFFQRGVGTATSLYGPDRWGRHNFQDGLRTQQSFVAGGEHPGNSRFVGRVAGDGVTSMRMQIGQGIELSNVIPLRGKTVTLSFLVRCSAASFSIDPTNFKALIGYTNASADASFSSTDYAASGSSTLIIGTQGSLPTTWTKHTLSFNVPLDANNIVINFFCDNLAVYSSTDWYEISQVMLNEGSVAVPFRRAGNTIAGEFALCQRYYETGKITNSGGQFDTGFSRIYSHTNFEVNKRAVPTISVSNAIIKLASSNVNDAANWGLLDLIAFVDGISWQPSKIGNFIDNSFRMDWTADAEL